MIRLAAVLSVVALAALLSSDAKAEGLGFPTARSLQPRVIQPRVIQPRFHRQFSRRSLLEGAIIVLPQTSFGLEDDFDGLSGLSSLGLLSPLEAVINPFPLFPRRHFHRHHRLVTPALRGLRGGTLGGGGSLRRR